jgi:hypothetical protein
MSRNIKIFGGFVRSYKLILLLLLSGAALGVSATSAAASPSPAQFVITSTNVSFDSSSATSATFTVSVINLTEQDAPLKARPTNSSSDTHNPQACSAAVNPNVLPATTQQSVTVTLHGCALPDKGGYLVTLTAAGHDLPAVSVTPATSTTTPNWKLFWAFPIAMLIAVLTLTAAGNIGWWKHWRQNQPEWTAWKWWWQCPLNLAASWSLSDSWASNVTVIGAAFAGVFGSTDVLTAVLGNDTDPVFALSIVSSAVATGLVGAAPLVLAVLRFRGGVTPAALLTGAALSVGAAGGELAVITLGASHLNLGGLQDWLWLGLVGGGLILLLYTFRTMIGSLTPKPHTPRNNGARPTRQPSNISDDAFQKMHEIAEALPEIYPPQAIADAYDEYLPYLPEVNRRSAVF